jgi:basic membrane protein A
MDPVASVAPEFPDVKFEHCSGYREGENMGRYFGRMYQARYLSGIAAGLLTEEAHLGYVAAFPIPEVIRGINAFALGVASVADEATVQVSYTNTWNDAAIESDVAGTLIDAGVDVVAQHQNYPAAAQTASDAGIWALGYNSPMGDLVGENYVTSPIWNWTVFYREAVKQVYEGTWEADFFWKGLDSGTVGLSDWGPKVPQSVRTQVSQERDRIAAGDTDIWEGTRFDTYSDGELFREMEQYVDNVTVGVTE